MRYILFGGESYNYCGGAKDKMAVADSISELMDVAENTKKHGYDTLSFWWHIYDTEKHQIVVKSL